MGASRDARSLHIAIYVILIICGAAFTILALAFIFAADEVSMILIGFLAFAVLLIILGIFAVYKVKRFRKYIDLVSLQSETSIELIAENTNQSVDYTRKDLQDMIGWGYFDNATINRDTNKIIIGDKDIQDIQEEFPKVKSQEYVTLICPKCSTSATELKGTQYNCKFCGMAQASEYKTLECPKCGTTATKPKGTWHKCRFCGTVI